MERQISPDKSPHPQPVMLPSPSDGVGQALRALYGPETDETGSFAELLAKIDHRAINWSRCG